jgi:hypothetical protein
MTIELELLEIKLMVQLDKEYWELTRTKGVVNKLPLMETAGKLLQVRIKLYKTDLPWQKTIKEFRKTNPISTRAHEKSVFNAIKYGYDVPADVLAEYPGIKKALT